MGKRPQNKVKQKKSKEIFRKPETTQIWQRLEKTKVAGKEECLEAFLKISKDIEKGKYNFQEGTVNMGKYFVISEADRQGSSFVHIVPSEAHKIFV